MTQRQPCQVYLTSLGFMLAYVVPLLPITSIWLGKVTQHPNIFAFIPLVIAYGLVPIIEAIFPYGIQPIPQAVSLSKGWQLYYRGLLWLSLPIQLGMLYVAIQYWISGLFNFWGGLAYLLSVGIYSGMFAITIGHELIHHSQRSDQFLGGILLSTVAFGTFKIVHLRIHHRYVCTPLDFATAQRGQSIYSFWWNNLIGNIVEALRYERAELRKTEKTFWHSELLLWYFFSLLWLGLAIGLGGWLGGIFWGLQALTAVLKLDWTNYLQHYGLKRQQEQNGHYESVKSYHAWSVGLFIHDLALFNLLRHGEHHVNPQKSYPFLSHTNNGPEYPYNYSIMYLLSLAPTLFQKVVHPELDRTELKSQESLVEV